MTESVVTTYLLVAHILWRGSGSLQLCQFQAARLERYGTAHRALEHPLQRRLRCWLGPASLSQVVGVSCVARVPEDAVGAQMSGQELRREAKLVDVSVTENEKHAVRMLFLELEESSQHPNVSRPLHV